jgi:leucyl aminopeptidase
MQVTIESRDPREAATDLLALPIPSLDPEKLRLPPRVAALDRALGGRLSAVVAAGDFRGEAGESLTVYPDGDASARRVLLIGLGPEAGIDADAVRCAAGTAIGTGADRKAKRVHIVAPSLRRLRVPSVAQALAEGAVLSSYRFERYRGTKTAEKAKGAIVESTALLFERGSDLRAARASARTGVVLGESQNLARDLSNEPANALPPAALAREAQKVAKEVGLKVEVLGPTQLERHGMNAILAVGQGSANPPRLVVLEHNAPPKGKQGRRGKSAPKRPTLCIVGKGVTFDSGGISIKPSAGMDEMKHDMSGAATVVGVMRACALLKVPLHVVGVIGAAENMPSGTAYRPGDVVTAMSGTTIEVLNTDAEGRVVLADALHYARTRFEPQAIIDLATLTGACVIALGKWASGLFGNNERLIERVRRAGETSAERAWPMPLWEGHRKAIRSDIADIKNTGGREAGSSTAAAFLAAFVDDTPWVHLDIAGTGWTSKVTPYQRKGATGVGVRLLLEMLREWKGVRLS